MRALLPVLLLATALFQAHAGDPPAIVGTWEMVRADGVSPRDIPPWGFVNLVVEFTAGGTVRHWIVGDGDEPHEGSYVYTAPDSTLVAWIGLSNDLESPRAVRIEGNDWLEVTVPEGFTATFRRVAAAPAEARCIFFTIDGQNHDPAQVRKTKQELFDFRPGPVPDPLVGTWTNTITVESEGSWRSTLRIDRDTATMIVHSVDYPEIPPEELGGPIEVSGDLLSANALYCGALSSFEVGERALVVSPDRVNSVTFTRVAE